VTRLREAMNDACDRARSLWRIVLDPVARGPDGVGLVRAA
jgi:hypothetical protein